MPISSETSWQRLCTAGTHVAEESLNKLSEQIIGAAISVHRRVGPGCLESAYAPCFVLELCRRRLDFRREVALRLHYDELVVDRAYVADFVVGDSIVVELKAMSRIGETERRQLQTYLEIIGYPLGLLINFSALKLVDGIKRVVHNFPIGTRREPEDVHP